MRGPVGPAERHPNVQRPFVGAERNNPFPCGRWLDQRSAGNIVGTTQSQFCPLPVFVKPPGPVIAPEKSNVPKAVPPACPRIWKVILPPPPVQLGQSHRHSEYPASARRLVAAEINKILLVRAWPPCAIANAGEPTFRYTTSAVIN